jgi:hypothetical protein
VLEPWWTVIGRVGEWEKLLLITLTFPIKKQTILSVAWGMRVVIHPIKKANQRGLP